MTVSFSLKEIKDICMDKSTSLIVRANLAYIGIEHCLKLGVVIGFIEQPEFKTFIDSSSKNFIEHQKYIEKCRRAFALIIRRRPDIFMQQIDLERYHEEGLISEMIRIDIFESIRAKMDSIKMNTFKSLKRFTVRKREISKAVQELKESFRELEVIAGATDTLTLKSAGSKARISIAHTEGARSLSECCMPFLTKRKTLTTKSALKDTSTSKLKNVSS